MLFLSVLIWTVSDRQIPVEVLGKLPAEDVAEIVSAAKREMRREIFPNLSWQSLKEAPKAIRAYVGIKLIAIRAYETNDVLVYLFRETNGFTAGKPDIGSKTQIWPIGTLSLHSLEKRTNGWFVIDSASF